MTTQKATLTKKLETTNRTIVSLKSGLKITMAVATEVVAEVASMNLKTVIKVIGTFSFVQEESVTAMVTVIPTDIKWKTATIQVRARDNARVMM